jgi:serine O-acetyltransferase
VAEVKIGAHVDIGAGAKIIRPVTVANPAKIGANAVVICDIPEGDDRGWSAGQNHQRAIV